MFRFWSPGLQRLRQWALTRTSKEDIERNKNSVCILEGICNRTISNLNHGEKPDMSTSQTWDLDGAYDNEDQLRKELEVFWGTKTAQSKPIIPLEHASCLREKSCLISDCKTDMCSTDDAAWAASHLFNMETKFNCDNAVFNWKTYYNFARDVAASLGDSAADGMKIKVEVNGFRRDQTTFECSITAIWFDGSGKNHFIHESKVTGELTHHDRADVWMEKTVRVETPTRDDDVKRVVQKFLKKRGLEG
jgi:hypothetical protein